MQLQCNICFQVFKTKQAKASHTTFAHSLPKYTISSGIFFKKKIKFLFNSILFSIANSLSKEMKKMRKEKGKLKQKLLFMKICMTMMSFQQLQPNWKVQFA